MGNRGADGPSADCRVLRVDVPNGETFRTAYYGPSAIYALHVTGEKEARTAAGNMGLGSRHLRICLQSRLTAISGPLDEEEEYDDEPI